ncbi:hypothetical protein BVG16_05295 [Paenibacillus selenitireducens]|uniref:Glycosyltransferase 2-like domain-containing protein n=1 Tax=Paenibacillus selenitireducens TaxID=1324314 RepID=A0A1T2XK17_9BACL|nr:glycosyltransferase family 2 protein [Paenibacillus selenitireducens]OPA80162.1 hypothetical protein BVG16_05295 [Paenibacillus selenitireducens]
MPSTKTKHAKHTQTRYHAGYEVGYREGLQAGNARYKTLFEGTSIVIPTFNKVDLLRQCLESIRQYTDVPYEIIVVDNASTDGTREYLKSLGRGIRYQIEDFNRGFAGAVNKGLMMAHGKTIVLLNNDIIVTKNWLSNMLACLHSDSNIGLVGPNTNYVGGEQLISVSYKTIEEMHAFAHQYNVSDSGKWQRIDRLVGFCLLFHRSLLEQTGYLDEGYEVGNFEDDDWVIRVRIQNKALVIAGDTFIHHFGSQSMRELGTQFFTVNNRNQDFFHQKWGNPYELVYQAQQLAPRPSLHAEACSIQAFYPTHMIVKGIGPQLYWVEQGMRHPFHAETGHAYPYTQISQLELRQWRKGEEVSFEDVIAKWNRSAMHPSSPEAMQHNTGVIVEDVHGVLYQLNHTYRRRLINAYAASQWHLQSRPRSTWSDEQLNLYIEGFPIIAPPQLRNMEL